MNQGTQDFPPATLALLQQQLAQFGRPACTRLIKVPDLSAAVPVAVGTVPGGPVGAPLLTWRDDGWVIGLYGQERTGTVAKFATTEFRLQFTGDVDFISNGSTGDFSPLLAVVGPNVNWFPMLRRVQRGDNWTITWRNYDTAAVANPNMEFAFVADADLGRASRDLGNR